MCAPTARTRLARTPDSDVEAMDEGVELPADGGVARISQHLLGASLSPQQRVAPPPMPVRAISIPASTCACTPMSVRMICRGSIGMRCRS